MDGRYTGRKGKSMGAALKPGQAFFESGAGRVARARILVTLPLTQLLLGKYGSEMNGNDDGTGRGVMLLPEMNSIRRKTHKSSLPIRTMARMRIRPPFRLSEYPRPSAGAGSQATVQGGTKRGPPIELQLVLSEHFNCFPEDSQKDEKTRAASTDQV